MWVKNCNFVALNKYINLKPNKMKTFEEMSASLRGGATRQVAAVVWPADDHTLEAVSQAVTTGIIDAVMIGAREQVEACKLLKGEEAHIRIVDATDPDDAARQAVAMVRNGEAQIIMKGLINTDNLLHAVLNKETGILPRGTLLTHIAAAQIPTYDKLLLFTDAAVIPYPTHEQRIEQVRYITRVARAIGIECPRVALNHCTEKVSTKFFPFTEGYAEIIQKAKDGEFGPCIVDGPLDVKTSCDLHAMQVKKIDSPLQGASDAIIFPDIEAGNAFYKAITLFAGATTAGMLTGASAPVVVSSRGDSAASKFNSIVLAACYARSLK